MKLFFSVVFGAAVALANPAWADVSRADAAALAQRATDGRVLAVDTAQVGGRPAWRVKVVTAQGEVRVIPIDVASVNDTAGLDAADARRHSLTQDQCLVRHDGDQNGEAAKN